MMLLFSILFALYVAYIWIDYFRMLDIFKKSNVLIVVSQFVLGAASVLIIFAWDKWAPNFYLVEKGEDVLSIISYNIVQVGLVEEFLKFLPFLLSYLFIKKHLEEPMDYILTICASALGFSTIENVMYFIDSSGITFSGRAIFSTVSHFFNTSLLAYAVIRWRFKSSSDGIAWILFAYILASLSHGVFNSILSIKNLKFFTVVILLTMYFTIVVNWFASALNSAINNSPHFNYQKYVDGNVLLKKLSMRYGIVIAAAVLYALITEGFDRGLSVLFFSTIGMGLVMSPVIFRITRLTLRKGHWFPLTFSFFLQFSSNGALGRFRPRYSLVGSSITENLLHRHFEKPMHITPISIRSSYLEYTRNAWMFDKIFIEDTAFFAVKIYHGEPGGKYDTVLIKDKQMGEAWYGSAPIVGIYEFSHENGGDWSAINVEEIKFIEWAWMADEGSDA